MTPVLLLSAPVHPGDYAGSFVSSRAFKSFQTLFGFDAQLRLFAEAARGAGCRAFFVPAPENFYLPQSYRKLLEITGAARSADLMHVRFGPIRTQRVAKGACNIALVAEDACAVPLNLGHHPFACGDMLPASTARALFYDPARRPCRTVTGHTVPATSLPAAFIAGDIDREALAPGVDDEPGLIKQFLVPDSLHVQSLAEFTISDWAPVADGRRHAESIDLRRVLIERRLRRRGSRANGDLVLVPWNLAHEGSMIPDLLAKLARYCAPESLDCRPVLFPYNLMTGGAEPLAEAIGRLRDISDRSPLTASGVLIARLTDPRDLPRLAELFSFAWIDGNDPERAWLARRLGAIGIDAALMRAASDEQPGTGAVFEIACDDRLIINVSDGFGPRVFISGALSVRALSELVKRSVAEIAQRRARPASVPAARPEAPRQAFFSGLRAQAGDVVAQAAE